MNEITNELMYGILKQIREGVVYMRQRIDDHDKQFKGIRHMLAAMQSDDFRHEAMVARLRADMERIKRRLELTDAE